MSAQTPAILAYVPGPLYPDLFGADTPIMVPVEIEHLNVYDVTVSILVRDLEVIRVVAISEDEAEAIAIAQAEDTLEGEEHEVVRCRERCPASDDQIAIYALKNAGRLQ